MKITKETVEKLAKISHLNISDEESKKLLSELDGILNLFHQIDSIDVSKIDISLHPISIENILRQDKIEKSLSKEDVFRNTKHKKNSYFEGPKI